VAACAATITYVAVAPSKDASVVIPDRVRSALIDRADLR
jgi:hypothetical protein